MCDLVCFFFFKQKTAYEMRISDWSSDVCSSDLRARCGQPAPCALLPPVEIGLEQIGGARRRQHKHEGDDEQSGIEMPAPDRAIERNAMAVGHPLQIGRAHV